MCGSNEFAPSFGRLITLEQSIGTVLAHDITEIRQGEYKGAAFKKGRVIEKQDLEHLARLGKRHLYVLDIPEGMMHEDDAALAMAEALAGDGIKYTPNPSEGKINLLAAHDGLLKVDAEALTRFNMIEGVMCASRHNNTIVKKNDLIAGSRAIPLVISKEIVSRAVDAASQAGGVFKVVPLASPLTGLIVTGEEVYSGLIEDKFVPVIKPKLEAFNCSILPPVFTPDDIDAISYAVNNLIDKGAELIVTTGGMSVDPDDVTRLGVQKAGAADFLYGSSVLPGAMLMLAEVRNTPIIGVPACGMFHDQTIFDLVLPRILAGEKISRRDLAEFAHGGLCLNCPECRYPVCPFGK